MLHSRAPFSIRYDVSSVPAEFKHPSESLTDRITNVEIVYKLIFSTYGFDDEELDELFLSSDDLYKANAGPINLFRDSDVPRDNIRIELRYCTESTTKIISSPLFDAMKEFTSFQNVVLELTDSCYVDEFALEDVVGFFACGGGEKVYGKFGILLKAMSQELEPSLGPSVMKSGTSRYCEPHGSRRITFHPRYYLAKSKATAENTPSTDDGLSAENTPVQGSIS